MQVLPNHLLLDVVCRIGMFSHRFQKDFQYLKRKFADRLTIHDNNEYYEFKISIITRIPFKTR